MLDVAVAPMRSIAIPGTRAHFSGRGQGQSPQSSRYGSHLGPAAPLIPGPGHPWGQSPNAPLHQTALLKAAEWSGCAELGGHAGCCGCTDAFDCNT
jgi:hypothetical protein